MRFLVALAVAGCGGSRAGGTPATLRNACDAAHYWDGACKPRGDAQKQIAAGKQALIEQDPDHAKVALDAAERGGPLEYGTHVLLWEQRGIAAAFLDDERGATSAFDMLLALDPSHFLSYTLSPKATFVFEKVRSTSAERGVPALDVNWPHGQRVGDPVPIDLEVVADPKQLLRRATLFVRTRGEPTWRAADVPLITSPAAPASPERRVLLPPVEATRPVSLELYLRAYDDHGNEVLTWADARRPREIPLRYDAPTPWYRRAWFYAAIGTVVAAGVGFTVYELTLAPPDKVSGGVSVK